jgi:hypothetical protein
VLLPFRLPKLERLHHQARLPLQNPHLPLYPLSYVMKPQVRRRAPLTIVLQGTGQIPSSAAGTPSPAPTSTASLVTSVTTLSDGSLSTSTSTPSAAAAQEAAATTPGKKLEVLPIGLGVFAGVSVIALIVVGLVTYERTKYRKVCGLFLMLWSI